jgi:hypothetical protein
MTLGVAKDTLLVGQDYLDQKNPVYRDFALSMSQRGIAAVTFIRGLMKEELTDFHRILTTKPDDIMTAGGIEKVIVESSIEHIRVMAVDYASFHVTEEQEIVKPQGKADEKQDLAMWQDFVSHLSAGTLAAPGQGVSLKDAERIDPLELARLLNERQLDANAALQSYDRIISSHIRGVTEKKQLTSEQSKTLASLNTLLRELHPDLRKQFLSVAFEVGEVRGGTILLERHAAEAIRTLPFKLIGIMVNRQAFTKTANCWGVNNNRRGTNTNRIVLVERMR